MQLVSLRQCAGVARRGERCLLLLPGRQLPPLLLRARDGAEADCWAEQLAATLRGRASPPTGGGADGGDAVRRLPPATDDDVRALLGRAAKAGAAGAAPPIRVPLRAGGRGALCAADTALPAPWLGEVLGWLDPPVPEAIVRAAVSAAAFFASRHAWAWC